MAFNIRVYIEVMRIIIDRGALIVINGVSLQCFVCLAVFCVLSCRMALGAFCFKLGQEGEKENELLGSPNQAIKLLCKGYFYLLGVLLLHFLRPMHFCSMFAFLFLLSFFHALLLERK